MSTEPDYNFNDPANSTASSSSLLLPLALVTSTLAIFMFAQTINVIFNRTNLRDNKEQLAKGKVQLTEAYKAREPVVKQSQEIQKKLQDLILDLLLLAKTDAEAQAIVTKYNIQQQAPAGGAESAAPAPAPAAPAP